MKYILGALLLLAFGFFRPAHAGDIYQIISASGYGTQAGFDSYVGDLIDIETFSLSVFESASYGAVTANSDETSIAFGDCEYSGTYSSIKCTRYKYTQVTISGEKQMQWVDYGTTTILNINFFRGDCGDNGSWDSDGQECVCDDGYEVSDSDITSVCKMIVHEFTCDEDFTDDYVSTRDQECAAALGVTYQNYDVYTFSASCSADVVTTTCDDVIAEEEPEDEATDDTEDDTSDDTADDDTSVDDSSDGIDDSTDDGSDSTDDGSDDVSDEDSGDSTGTTDTGVFTDMDSSNLESIKDALNSIDTEKLNSIASDFTSEVEI